MKRRIASWENGHSQPDEFYGALLEDALGIPPAELGLRQPDSNAPAEPRYPDSSEAALTAVTELWRADLADAPPSGQVSDRAWADASLRWLVTPEQQNAPATGDRGGVRVGMADVAVVKATADTFAALDDRFGGGHARRAVIQYLSHDVAPLLHGTYTESVGRALFATVAEALRFAGWMSYDAGHHALAQHYYLPALRLAQDANDRRLAGSVLSAMSHQATFVGRFNDAATLARAARMGISGVATPTLTAQFWAMEARALARTSDHRGAQQALSESERSLDRRNHADEPEWITYFDDAELSAEAAHCFRDINSAQRSVEHAGNAMSGSHVRSDFFATMVLADAHLRAGDVEEACRVALDALDLGGQLRSARAISYLAEFRTALAAVRTNAHVRDLHEQAAEHRLWTAAESTPDV
ncbi:hypothetical protein [Streptomyces sp. NPDC020983]|uniref:hypothetical protein n=1 Tax=Streptomyces sp. NPDC020983 TaxID=3365106 RepID=UPI00378828D4